MKKFDNEKYQILAKDLMGAIFYSEISNRNKIATIRQYAEVIVRKILDINPSKKMTIGANEISKKLDALNNSVFLKEALENIRQDGNKFTHTEYLEEVTSDEFDKIVDKLLDTLSFMLINYFETYEFGSRSDVLESFSLLPPIVRYKVLIFLYSKYPNNVHVIDKLALAIVKAFNREEAIRWTEKEKNNLINLDVMSNKVFNEIAENKGIEFAELIKFNSPYKNMYELCIDKIMKIGNEIDSKGRLYIDFESALPYYKQYGIIDEDSEEIKEFNDIMDFLYLGRKANVDNFIKLKEPYVVLDAIIEGDNINEDI
ncbi:TPA: hypothetical protein TUT10_001868 [Streptococcus equi subsp. zooepidemicus]|nr:hypothetical protein [Streptococcus equi subsp. zooepidemicus]